MTLLAVQPPSAAGQLALAAVLAAGGAFLLLPKPGLRSVAGGVAGLVAGLAVAVAWVLTTFGGPVTNYVETVLFALFAAGAVGFGAVLVTNANPARGAIAFAFVILSVCGLFLLLAAPFLMAATVIIYAGAIIVTFLFVLMLSQNDGPSDENDRTREPLLGSLAGFAFVGLILFALGQGHAAESALPAQAITPAEQASLRAAADQLKALEDDDFYTGPTPRKERADKLSRTEAAIEDVVGVSFRKEDGTLRDGPVAARLAVRSDLHAQGVRARVAAARDQAALAFRYAETAVLDPARGRPAEAKAEATKLREQLLLLAGVGELPARNVANLGVLLYADHLLAVELAGTLLLVATIGTVAIAHRRGTAA
ncbi:NADH-quinone oxidoreductase subunit J family protein [Urbifossiella limnaea]|uniref:NADH-quinone oxidoreductase subunit J n=1 Tax=Urbifossiella limnaea TaxID=2528023 RepID=A0A517XLQ0_9BACT|nr:NADH-quinone oxidoreductase subunit J [Urbifossiella limnaea]QDU18432.1 NADH-quinone oxidoreductase subunit J [Urbifossiella limnaea]